MPFMLVAHATWHAGALCLWAEHAGPAEQAEPGVHPYATNDFTGTSYEPLVHGAGRVELTMLLPGTADRPSPSPELGAEPHAADSLHSWRVPGLVLDPRAAMALLRSAEEQADVVPGTDLRFLALIADEALDHVEKGLVLPALVREDGSLIARWRSVIYNVPRFRDLAQAMPAACRAAEGGQRASVVLREALDGLTDTAVRSVVPHPLLLGRRVDRPERGGRQGARGRPG
jgi:hypothetical protein